MIILKEFICSSVISKKKSFQRNRYANYKTRTFSFTEIIHHNNECKIVSFLYVVPLANCAWI